MPPPQFTVESSQISILNGTYIIGHEFILDAGAINVGDQIIVRVIDNKRFDIGDFDTEYAGDGHAFTSNGKDTLGNYAKVTFDQGSQYLMFEFFIMDNYINDYVTLFKLKTV